jgi:hypothetical protein
MSRLDEPPCQVQTVVVRYFLDTEFNGFGGALLSLALVPEDGGEELYVTLATDEAPHDWVARHVIPYLDTVPLSLHSPRMDRQSAAISAYLAHDSAAEIIADWPDDLAYFNQLLSVAPGRMVHVPDLVFRLINLPGFSTAVNSAVPHNALHDARALRDHLLSF